MFILLLASLVAGFIPSPPEACYVAQIGVIVSDATDFRYHRVVTAGIRRLTPAPDATDGDCRPRDPSILDVMRRDIETHLEGEIVKPPRTRATITIGHASLEVVRSQITRLAALARDHRGAFVRVEVVGAGQWSKSPSDVIALPRLMDDEQAAAECAADNVRLEREGAKHRWAC
jgi:hypothetical protein